MRKIMKGLAAALAATLILGCAFSAMAAKKPMVKFSIGTSGGIWEMIGTGMIKVINERASFELVPVGTTSLNQVPSGIEDKEIDLALGSYPSYERAFRGIEDFEGNPSPGIRQVMSLYDNVMGWFVLGNSKIKTLEDLTDNMVIATPASNALSVRDSLRLLGELGMMKADPDKLYKKMRIMTYSQCSEQLSDGNADIIFLTSFPYSGLADALVSTKGGKYVPYTFDAAKMDKFRSIWNERHPESTMLQLPPGVYTHNKEAIWFPVVYTGIYTHKDFSKEIIKEFIDLCLKHVDEIAAAHPSAGQISVEANKRYLRDKIMTPERMHEGSIEYFKAIGIMQ